MLLKRSIGALVASAAFVAGAALLWPAPAAQDPPSAEPAAPVVAEVVRQLPDKAADAPPPAPVAPASEPVDRAIASDRPAADVELRPVIRDSGRTDASGGELRISSRTAPLPYAVTLPSDLRADDPLLAANPPSSPAAPAPRFEPSAAAHPVVQRTTVPAKKKPAQKAAAPQAGCSQPIWPTDLPAHWTNRCGARARPHKS